MYQNYEIVAVGEERPNQIRVDFTANVCKENETPCRVIVTQDVVVTPSFIGTKPDEPYTWVWDFGDGTTKISNETVQPVSHRYTMPGLYTVSLTGVKDDQSGTETKIGYIYVESKIN